MSTTQTYNERDLAWMSEHPNAKANAIGSRPPYHLQYLREGGVDIKPEVNHAEPIQHK